MPEPVDEVWLGLKSRPVDDTKACMCEVKRVNPERYCFHLAKHSHNTVRTGGQFKPSSDQRFRIRQNYFRLQSQKASALWTGPSHLDWGGTAAPQDSACPLTCCQEVVLSSARIVEASVLCGCAWHGLTLTQIAPFRVLLTPVWPQIHSFVPLSGNDKIILRNL